MLSILDNLNKYGEDAEIVIIGDLKSPHDKLYNFEKTYSNVHYWSPPKQKAWLKDYPKIDKIIPWNTSNRRNIGYLIAAKETGAEKIIILDDDNFVDSKWNFIKEHMIGYVEIPEIITSPRGWINNLEFLELKPDVRIYPRGHPIHMRGLNDSITKCKAGTMGRIVLNLGLWTNTPDLDAATLISVNVKSLRWSESKKHYYVARDTFFAINTQNTSFHKCILPCFYCTTMGVMINGVLSDRYDDILAGLFAKKIIDKVGDYASLGLPLTDHRRNKHHYLKDLLLEYWGMYIMDELSKWIRTLHLNEKTYPDAYVELSDELYKYADSQVILDIKKYLKRTSENMKSWVESCER